MVNNSKDIVTTIHKDLEKIDIDLYLTSDEKDKISDVQVEYLEEEMKEVLPEIKEGQINISGVYAFDQGQSLEVKVYIVNGLSRTINFEEVPLYIINSKGERLAYQIFDLRKMGDIPEHSARPWKFYFNKENVFVEEIPQNDWKVVFEGDATAVKYVDIELEGIPEGMDSKEINTFNEFLSTLPKLEDGQVSLSVFTMTQYKDGSLLMTLVMRNATNQSIQMKKLPITIKTADEETVLSGAFELPNCNTGAYKAKILSLVFKKEIMKISDFDLTTSKVLFSKE
ncbi:SLAP domain-containing protein [Clostridium rectalis]|uniref:SLAP domain-containing protein n=1 Tax=Clostridium rectalis TaxID=2040295 RepID=UPI000F6413C4|nr:SLAP domain-containing protein [Clostridium rectalis]